jgi:hypothetical protein
MWGDVGLIRYHQIQGFAEDSSASTETWPNMSEMTNSSASRAACSAPHKLTTWKHKVECLPSSMAVAWHWHSPMPVPVRSNGKALACEPTVPQIGENLKSLELGKPALVPSSQEPGCMQAGASGRQSARMSWQQSAFPSSFPGSFSSAMAWPPFLPSRWSRRGRGRAACTKSCPAVTQSQSSSPALNCPCGFAVVAGIAIVSAATDARPAASAAPEPTKRVAAVAPSRHMGSRCMLKSPTDVQWNCEQSPTGARWRRSSWQTAQVVPSLWARDANHARTMCAAAARRFHVGDLHPVQLLVLRFGESVMCMPQASLEGVKMTRVP